MLVRGVGRATEERLNVRDRITPDTVVLIHGLWMTPRSWEHWVAHYEAKGSRSSRPA